MNHKSLFIDGQWTSGHGSLFFSENPCTGDKVWQAAAADADDINKAVAAARNAQSAWAMLSIDERSAFTKRFQEILQNNKDELAQTISLETGKPVWESLTEVGAMIGKIDISIDAYHNRTGDSRKEAAGVTSVIKHKPHGVVAVFGPFNFPGHLPNGHIIPAMLAGNTLVFKPSELTPLVAEKMIQYWEAADLPKGVINLVQGARETGIALSQHKDIDGLFFTGSHATGVLLHQQFAGNLSKILALELGGNNPLVIDAVQNIDAAVYNTIQSAYITAGQRCTCARRLIVIKNNHSKEFVDRLVLAIKKIIVGAPTQQPTPFMGPVISNKVAEQLLSAQTQLIIMGGKSLVTMQNLQTRRPFLSPGLMDVTNIKDLPDQEYFGPLLQLIYVNNLNEAIKVSNQTQFGLAAGIFTDSLSTWDTFYAHIRAGIVNWNRPLTGASSSAPFGGVGASGNHKPSAYYAADYCAWPVASLEDDKLILPEKFSPGLAL